MKVIITGATGMVGEGVLLECLENPAVKQVLIVNRKQSPVRHPKLKELIVPDFMNLEKVEEQLTGYDACFYCAGISSVGVNEEKYTYVTYDTTIHFANKLVLLNPNMIFNFVTGRHTDSTEKGKLMWARVKGKTENALMKLPFKKVVCFRPGLMKPTKGQKNVKTLYWVLAPILLVFLPVRSNKSSTMHQIGLAMINTVLKDYSKQILEIKDINELAAL